MDENRQSCFAVLREEKPPIADLCQLQGSSTSPEVYQGDILNADTPGNHTGRNLKEMEKISFNFTREVFAQRLHQPGAGATFL